MRNVRELITLSTEYLQKRGVKEPRRAAEELLADLLNKKRLELYFDYDAPVEEREVGTYRGWIKRRGEKEPHAYIVGHLEFLGCKLAVEPGVLIPRQETEILAAKIMEEIPDGAKTLWDVCCGSGCLGLSIKKGRPLLEVTLSDLSEKALVVAKKNSEQNGLDVTFAKGDLLAPFEGNRADIVVCNPPYITEGEYGELEDEVRAFEPKEALVGGLTFYERLAKELPAHLNPSARLFLEIGKDQGEALFEIFCESCWKNKQCEKDWAGHDRFFFLEYNPN